MEKLLDNSIRGTRALFWMKVYFIVSLILTALGYTIWRIAHGQIATTPEESLATGMILVMLGLVAVSILMMIVVVVLGVSWITWLFRSTQNLQKLKPGTLSPWLATILSIIPFVGQVIHYFIFRNLIKGVQGELDSRSVHCEPVPMSCLNLYLGFSIVATVVTAFNGNVPIAGLGIVLGYAALVFYIRVLTVYTNQERELFKAIEDESLRQKVDQVLREREIEKAASQVHPASFQ